MDDQDLNALLDGDSPDATAEAPTQGADVAAETPAIDVAIEGVDVAADAAANMMGESNASSDAAADMAADMMGEAGDGEAHADQSATIAPAEVEALSKTSENRPGDAATAAKPAAKIPPVTLDERLKKELGFANLYLRDCESLILFRVFNKVHIAYYQAWIRDAREAMALISSLRRRRQRLERRKAADNSPKKDTESAA
jgi:hypothetical protein